MGQLNPHPDAKNAWFISNTIRNVTHAVKQLKTFRGGVRSHQFNLVTKSRDTDIKR